MRKYLLCLLAVIAGACATTTYDHPALPGTVGPLPLDPITPAEAARAQEIARSDDRTRQLLGPEARLVYVLSIAPKRTPSDDEPRGRHADLLYIRNDNEFGVRVLVDLVAGRVVDQARVPASSVPLGRSDVAEALRIAVESPELRELLGARASEFHVLSGPLTQEAATSDFVEGLRHTGAGPNDPCSRDRCVYLLFNSGGHLILQDREILVDLNTRRVRVTRAGGNP